MNSSTETAPPSRSNRPVLVIMAKAPRPGRVKTRLIPGLSPDTVTDFYRCLLNDTLALALSLNGVDVAIMCPALDVNDLAQLAGQNVSVISQSGEGLAAGLTSVFRHFTDGSQRSTIAFNSDSPHLPRSVLEAAFEALAAHDVVIGPTFDGGYYLIGAKASYPALFVRDDMGTNTALETLLSRARELALSIGFVDTFYDIDLAEDMTRLAAELQSAPSRAPSTAEWLKQWQSRTRPGNAAPGGL
jgi:rSAM/selenodomain-associated transferase 1